MTEQSKNTLPSKFLAAFHSVADEFDHGLVSLIRFVGGHNKTRLINKSDVILAAVLSGCLALDYIYHSPGFLHSDEVNAFGFFMQDRFVPLVTRLVEIVLGFRLISHIVLSVHLHLQERKHR
jgi:hypothetical protein